jgi:hypothetical protein
LAIIFQKSVLYQPLQDEEKVLFCRTISWAMNRQRSGKNDKSVTEVLNKVIRICT